MSGYQKIAPALTRAWVRLYTSGMPPDLRDARRAEIDADLWEQQHDGRGAGVPRGITALEIGLRTLLGIPDDLGWRFEAIKARRVAPIERRIGTMAISAGQIRWMGFCGLLGGILWAANVVYGMPGYFSRDFRFGYPLFIAVWLLFALGVIGLYLQQRGRLGKTALAGVILLLTGFLSMLIVSGLSAIGVRGGSLVMNILAFTTMLITPPGFLLGFLLLGIGMTGLVRRVLLTFSVFGFALGAVGLAGRALGVYFPWASTLHRGDSLLGMATFQLPFFLMGIALAVIGYSVLRNVSVPEISR